MGLIEQFRPLSHLRTDLIGSPQKAYPQGVRPLPTRVPKTERKPEHRPKLNPLGSERSKNGVRVVKFLKRPFLEQ